ncbi:hypothetical protein [uncultured Desulfobacter sp.]|uniref:hypothetical protein n=1 Tax=uncultured Desulfobacter sp. TaxID=240139 RepID=UPI002AA7C384|nr:hypothetical protein [uncultured Desulfobacter sp.]
MAINFQQFSMIQEELRDGLILFWKKAENVLSDSGVELVIPKRDDIHLEDHFFSLLFLYAYFKAGIDPQKGIYDILPPKSVLNDIHSIKTGLLFQAPWALPDKFEDKLDAGNCEKIKEALFSIGLGCQILDDLVDLIIDLKMKRHNYVVSLFYESEKKACLKFINTIRENGETINGKGMILALQHAHPDLFRSAAHQAETFITSGCRTLFSGEQESMIPFCVSFLIQRIGAQSYFESHQAGTRLK